MFLSFIFELVIHSFLTESNNQENLHLKKISIFQHKTIQDTNPAIISQHTKQEKFIITLLSYTYAYMQKNNFTQSSSLRVVRETKQQHQSTTQHTIQNKIISLLFTLLKQIIKKFLLLIFFSKIIFYKNNNTKPPHYFFCRLLTKNQPLPKK